ncbi:HIT family protein [Candidatus Woesebacteria bacterium]|nr:HIT family protein [Candidatus Woesebacteria bacterium]MCD8506807.1 HIT family protein [Candidatus Woesebacteria bacterium]MCD8527042.1 HIT family protein [Candidatus Woesebacteria bacterium]MCD8546315.1 HIT family protein [Candidatus Woesebacteria bacterium]
MAETLFDLVIREEIPTWKVWEDETYVAFLTPFPNTPGVTVVIPKVNHGDYVFELEEEVYLGLMKATQKVAKALEKALDVSRVALVFEGTGVAHVHAKLYPLHGELGSATDIWSKHQEFYPNYVGYLTTVEGPKMSDADLDELQAKISAELQ